MSAADSWGRRLGQTQPVKAVFAVYKDAMEAQALALLVREIRMHWQTRYFY
jgi:hypothetical protein